MSTIQFAVVDVFSSTAYKGNPLAVVSDLEGSLSDNQMKLITRQFNLSETTFFSRPTRAQATFRLRSFLPDGREVFGIGHNILGVWWYLAQDGFLDFSSTVPLKKSEDVEEFTFYQELGDSVMPVNILRTKRSKGQRPTYSVSIAQATPKAHGQHPNLHSLAKSIGLEEEDIGIPTAKNQTLLKPRVMSTASTYHLLVPVKSTSALDRVTIQRDKLLEQLSLVDDRAYGIFLFTSDASGSDDSNRDTYRARFFSPGMSTEDPATGSAAGPLSLLLYNEAHLSPVEGEANITVWQGHNVGRECEIKVRLSVRDVSEDRPEASVELIGEGVKISEGSIMVPASSVVF